ncbi:methionine--tRNA ligase, partial [bacterium]|nr:methionine--tRNA ligase [bacterium]
LLLLEVDIGTEKRNLVAGLAQWYKPEELVGKHIIVVANLKPAKIRGYESQGMLLAADDGKTVSVLTVDREVPPGSRVR